MYTPIPGFVHLHAYRPQTRAVPPHQARPHEATPHAELSAADLPAESSIRAEVTALARLAIDVVGGLRPVSHLDEERFDTAVLRHLRAWRRRSGQGGHGARMLRLHVRADGEFFGTAQVGPRHHAFTGTADGDHLTSFRVI